jgi:hypothetical protein
MEPAVRDLVVKRRLKNMAGGAGTCAAMDYKEIMDREQKAKTKKAVEGLQNPVELANEDVLHGITGVQLLIDRIDSAQGAGMDAGHVITQDEMEFVDEHIVGGA